MRSLRHDERRLIFIPVGTQSLLPPTCTSLRRLSGNTAHAVNCQVFLPPFYPRAVHVISRTRLSPVLVYYGFKGCSLYARKGEPGDEAKRTPRFNQYVTYSYLNNLRTGLPTYGSARYILSAIEYIIYGSSDLLQLSGLPLPQPGV